MNSRSTRATSVIALILSFAIAQVYVGVSFAQAGAAAVANDNFALVAAQQTTGVISIPTGKAITINGASAISGATVLSGATIETPAGVGSSLSLGSLGSVDIEPGSRLSVEFQDGSIEVTLLQGCVTLRTNAGVTGEVNTPTGVAGKTDPKADGEVRVCHPAVGAVSPAATASDGGGLFGLGSFGDVALLAGYGTIVASPWIFGNRNISPTGPN